MSKRGRSRPGAGPEQTTQPETTQPEQTAQPEQRIQPEQTVQPEQATQPEQTRQQEQTTGPGDGDRNGATASQDTIAELETTITGLETRIADLADQRLRAVADLDNVRKRCAGQVSRAETDTQASVARQWLPVVDNLERALEHAQAEPGVIIEGIRAIRDQALSVLAQLGFPRRDDLGSSFDPGRHEAVAARADAAARDGSVIEVVRPGYGDGGRQLRPAQVVVAKAE
jgi:molecular chaperone GrpE